MAELGSHGDYMALELMALECSRLQCLSTCSWVCVSTYVPSLTFVILSLWLSFYLPLDSELHENRALCAFLIPVPYN